MASFHSIHSKQLGWTFRMLVLLIKMNGELGCQIPPGKGFLGEGGSWAPLACSCMKSQAGHSPRGCCCSFLLALQGWMCPGWMG